MKPWDLDYTRQKVEERFGLAQLQVVRKCLESIVDRQRYAGYHFHEYKRILGEHIDDKLSSKSIYEVTLPIEPVQTAEIDLCLMRVSANIVACVQSMHSLADILAHVMYFSTGQILAASPLPEHHISMHSVIDALRLIPEYAEISDRLREIAEHPDFRYLTALVNHSKHRSIVGTVLSVAPSEAGQPPYALLFDEFSYKSKQYARQEIAQYLEPTYSLLSWRIVACGNALNRSL